MQYSTGAGSGISTSFWTRSQIPTYSNIYSLNHNLDDYQSGIDDYQLSNVFRYQESNLNNNDFKTNQVFTCHLGEQADFSLQKPEYFDSFETILDAAVKTTIDEVKDQTLTALKSVWHGYWDQVLLVKSIPDVFLAYNVFGPLISSGIEYINGNADVGVEFNSPQSYLFWAFMLYAIPSTLVNRGLSGFSKSEAFPISDFAPLDIKIPLTQLRGGLIEATKLVDGFLPKILYDSVCSFAKYHMLKSLIEGEFVFYDKDLSITAGIDALGSGVLQALLSVLPDNNKIENIRQVAHFFSRISVAVLIASQSSQLIDPNVVNFMRGLMWMAICTTVYFVYYKDNLKT